MGQGQNVGGTPARYEDEEYFQIVLLLILLAIPIVLLVIFLLKSSKRNRKMAELEQRIEQLEQEKLKSTRISHSLDSMISLYRSQTKTSLEKPNQTK